MGKCPNCGAECTSYDVVGGFVYECPTCGDSGLVKCSMTEAQHDAVNSPSHYAGAIECIDYIRDKLTPEGFTEYCIGNVIKYISRWRKKDGVQDLKKAGVYLGWAVQSAEREAAGEQQK